MRPGKYDAAMCAETVQAVFAAQRSIASRFDPQAVAQAIAEETMRLAGAERSLILLLEGERLVAAAQAGGSGPRLLGITIPLEGSLLNEVLISGQARTVSALSLERFAAQEAVVLPLRLDAQALGVVIVASAKPMREDARTLLDVLAPGAAQALLNARQVIHAQRRAVLAERRRVTRQVESVLSSTLFSASLIAEILPRLWERNPVEGRLRMDELRRITRSALEEVAPLTESIGKEG